MDIHFSCVAVEGSIVVSNLEGFCDFLCNTFAVLFYFHEVGYAGSGVVIENSMSVTLFGDTTVMFFTLFSKHLLDSPM